MYRLVINRNVKKYVKNKGAFEVYFYAWPLNEEKSYYSIIFKVIFCNFSECVYIYIYICMYCVTVLRNDSDCFVIINSK